MLHRDPYKELPEKLLLRSYGTVTAYLPCWAWAVMEGPRLLASDYGIIDDPRVYHAAAKHGQQIYMQNTALGRGLRFLESEGWHGDLTIDVQSQSLVLGLRDDNGKAMPLVRKCREIIEALTAGDIWEVVSVPWECLDHVITLTNMAHTEWSKGKKK